ncbi:hypothetical protein SAMD00024442_57_12 [Candidatus Symbiothrix dinenymphae]|nr:hypothetical protein SAMD00024442_57_12 [Candidatus Symbiothrix dinenymphae]
MKKNVILIAIVAAFCSCNDDMFDNIKERADAEIIYPVGYKQADVKAFQGDKRVEIELYPTRVSAAEMERLLPLAKKTVVVYNDTTVVFDSVYSRVNIPNLTIPNTILFKIYTENEHGDRSIPVEVRQKPFTDDDKGALVVLASFSASHETGLVTIAPAAGSYALFGVKYSYTDNSGSPQNGQVTGNKFIVNNLTPGITKRVSVSCKVLPNETLDTLWINDTVDVKPITQAAFDAYFNETQPFPTGTQHILSATPCELNGGDFDIGGQDLSYYKRDPVYHDNATYRPAGGDPINKVCIWANATTNASWWYGVAWVTAGDWVVYTLDVQVAGDYKIEVYKAGDAGTASCDIDNMNYWGTFSLPNSGWNTGISAEIGTVYLGVGKHKMKWTFVGGNFALLGFQFTKV